MGKLLFFILKLAGWRIDPFSPQGIRKAVVVVAPHTSNWDFVIGKIAFMKYGITTKFLIKKELFIPPFGGAMKKLGGVPIDRKSKNNFTEQAVAHFEQHDDIFIVFTPEGTRSYAPHWKKGFYHIAVSAQVPIYLAYIDYENKTGGFHGLFQPSGNTDQDILEIKRQLAKYKGRFPDNGIRLEDIQTQDQKLNRQNA